MRVFSFDMSVFPNVSKVKQINGGVGARVTNFAAFGYFVSVLMLLINPQRGLKQLSSLCVPFYVKRQMKGAQKLVSFF